jgi:hypothetical protein
MQGTEWLTVSQILNVLCLKTCLNMTSGGAIRLGILLKKEGFPARKNNNKYSFLVARITDNQLFS